MCVPSDSFTRLKQNCIYRPLNKWFGRPLNQPNRKKKKKRKGNKKSEVVNEIEDENEAEEEKVVIKRENNNEERRRIKCLFAYEEKSDKPNARYTSDRPRVHGEDKDKCDGFWDSCQFRKEIEWSSPDGV